MYKNEDFERFFLRYKSEAYPAGESIQSFCLKNNVAYNLFEKWYRDTRKKIVEVRVEGSPHESVTQEPEDVRGHTVTTNPAGVRILADIHVSNGLHVRQKNLSYEGLIQLVEKLEGLC